MPTLPTKWFMHDQTWGQILLEGIVKIDMLFATTESFSADFADLALIDKLFGNKENADLEF